MKETYFYKFNDTLIEFKCSSLRMIEPTLRKRFKKLNIDVTEHILSLGFELKKCKICNLDYNPNFHFEFNIDKNSNVHIMNVITGKSTGHYDRYYCYGHNKECLGIYMNSNSIEFISKTLDLTEEAALEYIHSHNKSPFYKENHLDKEAYKKSQSRSLDYFKKRYGLEEGVERYNIFNKKLKYSLSKEGFISKYGEKDGIEIWNKISKRKGITIKGMIDKYGENGYSKYKNWIDTCSKSNVFYLEKYGIKEGLIKINKRNQAQIESRLKKGTPNIPKDLEIDYMIYSKFVWDETNYQLMLYGGHKFGKDWKKNKKDNSLHVDHNLSIKDGFINNIEPQIIANIENLELIPSKINLGKKGNSYITEKELIEKIKNSKYGEKLYRIN